MSAKTSYLVPLIKTVEIYFKQNKQSINEKVLSHDHGDGATKKSTLFKDQLKKNIFFSIYSQIILIFDLNEFFIILYDQNNF